MKNKYCNLPKIHKYSYEVLCCCLYIMTLSIRHPVKIKLIIQDYNYTSLSVQFSVEDVSKAARLSPVTVKAGQGTTS